MLQNGKYLIKGVITHCSATRAAWMDDSTAEEQWAEIKHWHVDDNGWNDVGYHYGIGRNGEILIGRQLTTMGAHVLDHNAGTIGICIFGGHGATQDDQFTDWFTPEQKQAYFELVISIQATVGGTLEMHGHNEYANKGCPGFNLRNWWDKQIMRDGVGLTPDVEELLLLSGALVRGKAEEIPPLVLPTKPDTVPLPFPIQTPPIVEAEDSDTCTCTCAKCKLFHSFLTLIGFGH